MLRNNIEVGLIEKELWGNVSGKEIYLFCFKNKRGTKLYTSNYGAAVQSLFVKNKHGHFTDVLLGYNNLKDYQDDDFYIGTVVGRNANRISGGEVFLNGKKYNLATREGGYHLHGGACGFNKKVFDFRIPDDNIARIEFFYTSPDMEEGFPGELKLKVTYTLDDEDNWIIQYECNTDKTTIVNLTQHAYFNLQGHDAGSIVDHIIQIYSGCYLPVNKLQVPDGKIAPVRNTPFDFTRSRKIGKRIHDKNLQLSVSSGYDHSWVLKEKSSLQIVHAASVMETTSGIKLDLYTTEPAVHFYSGNFLKNVPGKNHAIYNSREGFCLETQHYPDAPNQPHFPTTILKQGQQFYSKTIYSFATTEE
jgi:aldose 1-epimerase